MFYFPAHVDDLFPFFLRHAKQIFPVLECKDDLRKISDLRIPPNWLVSLFVDLKCEVFNLGSLTIIIIFFMLDDKS